MIHYHGGPITPDPCAIKTWKGRHAFISFSAPQQMNLAAEYSQSFAFDNGAYSFWKAKRPVNWLAFYVWVDEWLTHPGFDFAVVPDVIAGTEQENDDLLAQWPFPRHLSAPVWHINESTERFRRLCLEWPRVCVGSSGEYDVSRPVPFLARMAEVLPAVLDGARRPIAKLHGLRMLNPAIYSKLPLSSADSTNVARNIGVDVKWRGTYQPLSKETRAVILTERIEALNSVGEWPA